MYTAYTNRIDGLYMQKMHFDKAADAFRYASITCEKTGLAACVIRDAEPEYDIFRIWIGGKCIAPLYAKQPSVDK